MATTQATEAIFYQGTQLNINHTPSGADVVAGEVVQIGAANSCGVANVLIADGRLGAIDIAGIYKFAKDAVLTFTAGGLVDWDDTLNEVAAAAAGDFAIGICTEDAAAADNFVLVKLELGLQVV